MADLRTLLKSTMLLTAAPGLRSLGQSPSFVVREPPPFDGNPLTARIWSYNWSPSALTEVTDVSCRVRLMPSSMPMPVASSINWGPASVRFRMSGSAEPITRELPLTQEFLVESHYLDGGDHCSDRMIQEGASALWPLAAT